MCARRHSAATLVWVLTLAAGVFPCCEAGGGSTFVPTTLPYWVLKVTGATPGLPPYNSGAPTVRRTAAVCWLSCPLSQAQTSLPLLQAALAPAVYAVPSTDTGQNYSVSPAATNVQPNAPVSWSQTYYLSYTTTTYFKLNVVCVRQLGVRFVHALPPERSPLLPLCVCARASLVS